MSSTFSLLHDHRVRRDKLKTMLEILPGPPCSGNHSLTSGEKKCVKPS